MSHTITLEPSGREFVVDEGEAILAAAVRQGIGLPYGCRDGACGACKSRLLSGQVVHRAHQPGALSAAEEAAGLILTCCATPGSDCRVEARTVPGAGEHPVLKMPARVLAIERPSADVAVLRLQLPANQNFQYRAGQYVDFILRDGARRSYSMARAPENLGSPPALELHIRHMPGGRFTDHLFGALKERDILRLEGPYGSFFLREGSTQPLILLASGTGFAPIQALIEQLQASDSTRTATLYWGCRRQADLYRDAWCREAANAMPTLRYVPVLSEAGPDEGWSGRTGFVHAAVMDDFPDLSGHEVYACGAPAMVDAARRDFAARCGLAADAFHADAFTSEADKQSGA
jgi:CDP-4-dehydro-6-deoxyglucose reductase